MFRLSEKPVERMQAAMAEPECVPAAPAEHLRLLLSVLVCGPRPKLWAWLHAI